MSDQPLLRRSALYVPANNPRAMAKAPTLAADVIIYDLEDAVLAEQKDQALRSLKQHLTNVSHPQEVVVRVNPVDTAQFQQDLAALAGAPIAAILLPKVKTKSQVVKAQQALENAQIKLPIWLMIETVEAVINLAKLVKPLESGAALVFGAEDLAAQMQLNPTPGRLGLLPIMSQLVLYARSANLYVFDAVFTNVQNELGFSQACEQGSNLGFDGKSLIHPSQIDVANNQFGGTEKQIDHAMRVLKCWHQRDSQQGIAVLDGEMLEQLHVDRARLLLAKLGRS